MKEYKIGLLGCAINNTNLGCVALTYSLLSILEEIAHNEKLSFNYYVFEGESNQRLTNQMCHELNMYNRKVNTFPIIYHYKKIYACRHIFQYRKTQKMINNCDIFIDLTEGDSFTDIYGVNRFKNQLKIKKLIEKKGKNLILGPQTYGPFLSDYNFESARMVLTNAYLIMCRDYVSADYLKSKINKLKICVTTDLAFLLPYEKINVVKKKVWVGINVSGLLSINKSEKTELCSKLKVDYDRYIYTIIDYLIKHRQFEIHLIPHVKEDEKINILIKEKFPQVILHEFFDSPIKAKSCIASMDIFLGSRMHATIAAFSTGVFTIPIAYSRKFVGLFENIGYDYVIDLQNVDFDKAVEQTIEYLKKRDDINYMVRKSKKNIEDKCNVTKEVLKECILSL